MTQLLATRRNLTFRRLATFAAALLLAFRADGVAAEINVVRDLGCRLDDWDFDNGPLLNAALARVGSPAQQKLNEEFYLPGGALVFKTPLVLPRKTGVSIRGNGITIALSENAFFGDATSGGPASRLVYIGPPDQPAITYRGMGLKLDGVTLQHGRSPHPPAPPPHDGSIGLKFEGYNGLPTGKIFAPQLAILGFDTAIDISADPTEKHADQNLFGYLWIQNCWTVFRSDNPQSVGNHFQHLVIGGGWCDTVFDLQRGGDLIVDTMILNTRALVLRLRDLSRNSCYYDLRFVKFDNIAAGWRLVQMEKPGPLRLRVAGHIGGRAAPGPDPIQLLGDPAGRDVSIDLWWNNRRWP
jgi:hypothetical protein